MPPTEMPEDRRDPKVVLDGLLPLARSGSQSYPAIKNYLSDGTLFETRNLRQEIDRRRADIQRDIEALNTIRKFSEL